MKKIVHLLFCIILLLCSANLYAGIIYVTQTGAGTKDGSSWENALEATQLKGALDNAGQGTDFWIAAGTYYTGASGNNTASFVIRNGVNLYGGFNGTESSLSERNISTNITILSGDLDQSNSHTSNDAYQVLTANEYTFNYYSFILDGFTIEWGNAVGTGDYQGGGGLYLNIYGQPQITSCIFKNNYGNYGGAYNASFSAFADFYNCAFIDNTCGYWGGAFYMYTYAGLYYTSWVSHFTNCIFNRNSSVVWGAGGLLYTRAAFLNCSFSNTSGDHFLGNNGGNTSEVQLTNCIVWGGTTIPDGEFTINYSDIQGGWTGTGSNNINADPGFANEMLELLPCSHAIDAGTNTGAPSNDYLNNIRPYNGVIVDMGAYEYQGNPVAMPTPVISYDSLVLTCSAGSATGVTLTSDAVSGNQWLKDGIAVNGATAQTYNPVAAGKYTVQVTAGCPSAMSDTVVVSLSPPPGNPSVFGDNVWNVYAWNAGDYTYNSQTWNTNYTGYYIDSSVSFDTKNKWNDILSPSSAPGFQGCTVQADNHSWSAKRKGFPCGRYTINIPGHDDAAQLFIDSVMVWEHNGCCDPHNNVWTGNLGPNSLVEFRATEGGGSSYGVISTNYISANPPVPAIVAGQTISCNGTPISLVSSSLTSNQWYLNGVAIPGAIANGYSASVTGDYTVQVTSSTGCTATSAVKAITIGIPGDTAQFGNNAWNVYAFNAGNGTLGSGAWISNYIGYYVDTAVQFDTRAKWNENTSPSSAPGFLGCGTVNNDNHSWSAKRKGFPCGYYRINIPGHDDAAQLFVNGVKVWEHNGCCDAHYNVWEGDLNATSTIVYRCTDGGGPSNALLNIEALPYPIAGVKFICGPTGQTTLDAGTHDSYLWSTGATTKTITVQSTGQYSVTVNDGGCQQTGSTTIQTGSPLDSLTITAASSSSCPGSPLTLTANAYKYSGDTNKIYTTRTYYVDVAQLINMSSVCFASQGNVYIGSAYRTSWGFRWRDSGNTPVVSAKIEFAVGYDENYYYGGNHPTNLNGMGQGNVSVPNWSDCGSILPNPVYTVIPNKQAYNLGGDNTFMIGQTYDWAGFGLRRWFNGYFAKITVTYYSDISYAWTPGDLTSQTVTVNPTETSDYNLAVNYQGCVSTASYHAVVNPVPTITADGSTTICPGSSVTLTASDGTSYLWSNGATTKSIVVTTPGTYSVTVDNCASSSGVTVNYKSMAYISANGPTTFCPGYGIDLTVNEAVSYAWSTGATTQSIHVTDSGSYSVQVTDTTGCVQTATQQINVQPLVRPELITYDATRICDSYYGYTGFYVSNFDYANTYSVNSDSVKDYGYGTFATAYPGMYTVTTTDALGCVSEPSDPIALTGAPGNPADFGNNEWNVYAFDNGFTYWGYNEPWTQYIPDMYGYGIPTINAYYGYYTDSTLSFNSQNKWSPDGLPADASNFQGCGMPYSYGYLFSWSAKRNGFPCGNYQINVQNHDDEAELWINGVNVWSEGGASGNASNNVWQGVLGPNSTVVFRVNNSGLWGQSYGAIDLVLIDGNTVAKPTISPEGPITICEGSATTLTSSASTGNLWSTGATTQSINVSTTGNYTVIVRNEAGCSAQSDAVSVTVLPVITWYRDADNDGFGNPSVTTQDCTQPPGYVANNTDCNDTKANIFPKTWYRDFDGDGYGNPSNSTIACTKPAGYLANKADCNDSSAAVHPGATEICDGIDNDCDGVIDEGFAKVNYYRDADVDGYGDPAQLLRSCSVPAGYVTNKADCNDANASVHPGAVDICDGLDNDCDGLFDEDCVSITINDTAVTEGQRNQKAIRFTVTLSKKSSQAITVNYSTQNGTATAGTDYVAQSGSVNFPAGVKKAQIVIAVFGDNVPEADETFGIVLNNPVNATIADGSAIGTILNDDGTTIAGGGGIALKVEDNTKTSASLAPNPASNKVYVSLKGYSGNVTINITSLEGKPLLQRKVQAGKAKLPQECIDVSRLAMGVYMVMIIDEHGNIRTERLVIQR